MFRYMFKTFSLYTILFFLFMKSQIYDEKNHNDTDIIFGFTMLYNTHW